MTESFDASGARLIRRDDMIWIGWLAKGVPFEPETTPWVFDVMARRRGWFVDVGASTGWFSVPMAVRGHHVVAFEPNPAVARRLRENSRLNGERFRVVERAASDRCAVATFWHNPKVPLTSGGSIERATCAKPEAIEVATVTLDGELGAEAAVALLKVDVEGHELAVLRGAAEIIARCRPHLVLEANTDAHRDGLAGWLDANGYDWRRADERNMLCSPRS